MDEILDALKAGGKAMDVEEIAHALGKPAEDVRSALLKLAGTGAVLATKKGKYALPETLGLVAARTIIWRNGTRVARPLRGGADMIIREQGELLPMLDDLILVRPEPHDDGDDRLGSCQLVSVTRRAQETFWPCFASCPGRLRKRDIINPASAGAGPKRPPQPPKQSGCARSIPA